MAPNSAASGKSLNPAERSEEVSQASFRDGLMAGALALLPSAGGVWYGVNYSATFRKVSRHLRNSLMGDSMQ